MAGTFIGSTDGTSYPRRKPARDLAFRFAFPPERNIRDKEDSPGGYNPNNLWVGGNVLGGEETGMWPIQITVYDDDIRFQGTKAFSYQIRGVCYDAGGAVVPGATVELWLSNPTWDGANEPRLIGTTTADANGKFGFAVPDTTTKYFITAYNSSKGGVTVRNVVGA